MEKEYDNRVVVYWQISDNRFIAKLIRDGTDDD